MLNTKPLSLDPKGEVGMEIVNIGLRPLFIERADMRIRNRVFTFYEHDPIPQSDNPAKINESMKSLEPSQAIRYKLTWDFAEHPLLEYWGDWSPRSQEKEEDIEVEVETTKKTFTFQPQSVNQILFHATLARDRKETSK